MPHALDGTPWPGGGSASTVIGWYRRPSARCLQPGYRCMGDEFSVAKYGSVADYMADLPRERRAAMEDLRRAVTEAAPEAIETIAYNMPALRLDGKFLVSYQAFKNHYSLFPWSDRMARRLGDALKPYLHGKGTIRFRADQPIPADLVRQIVGIRMEEVRAER
jgi:uncharacterized protein YdhG (YjbR/CyaY superfamily)